MTVIESSRTPLSSMERLLQSRQNNADSGSDTGDQFLNLISDPFSSEISSNSFYAALVWSFGVSSLLFLAFCALRPRTRAIYAPRAKHADEKHAPPPVGKGLFSWFRPVATSKELDLMSRIGLDAVIFLRFMRMLRNIFLAMTPVALGILLPINLLGSHNFGSSSKKLKRQSSGNSYKQQAIFMKMTPEFTFGQRFWAYTVVAYLFTFIVLFFIWWNYRAVLKLRRVYFESPEYKSSLHSRTLMITQIPKDSRTDDALAQLAEAAKPTGDIPKAAIARNVKEVPELIEEHDESVEQLEKYLARYLGNPDKLPAKRPTCKPSKKDKARRPEREVDAIEYYTERIKELELQIKETRQTLDKRNPMPYGFASYTHIEDAHGVAFAAKKKGPLGTDVRLAPKPHDIIWANLPMTRAQRKNKTFWSGVAMTLLTIVYVVPNILTAVFLSNLSNLGKIWKDFNTSLYAHPTGWGIVQGIVAPLIQTLFYMFLPSIFRRLFHNAGDMTKTSRERHVTSRLFAFYVFNQLIVFSIFGTIFTWVASVVKNTSDPTKGSAWEVLKGSHPFTSLLTGLCNLSPYWVTWQLQRNLGAAIDILQLWPLVWNTFQRRFMKPTPRELIKLSAPQPFEYADYYNSYLFVACVGLAFGSIQPLIVPITAFYIGVDMWFKNYLLQYVLITRIESGGVFWRVVINRLLACVMIMNLVIALLVGAKGIGDNGAWGSFSQGGMLYVMVPIPFLIYAFKIYCQRTFDKRIAFYTTQTLSDLEGAIGQGDGKNYRKHQERVGVKFGHPALYRKLKTPMVASKSQHLLKQIYLGRLGDDDDTATIGYSDIYMNDMSHTRPGKPPAADAPFEFVDEHDTDFENFKRRAEFRDEFGGDGELYGRPEDMSRPGTPGSSRPMSSYSMGSTAVLKDQFRSRSQSPAPRVDSRASSRTRVDDAGGVTYPKGYHQTAGSRGGERMGSIDIASGHPAYRGDFTDEDNMLTHAASMGQRPGTPGSGMGSPLVARPAPGGDYFAVHGTGGSNIGTPMDDDTSYENYRRGRRH